MSVNVIKDGELIKVAGNADATETAAINTALDEIKSSIEGVAAESSMQEAITKIDSALAKIDAVGDGVSDANTGIAEVKTGVAEIKAALTQIERAMNVYNVPVYGFIEHMGILNPAQRIEYIEKNKDFTPATMNFTTGALNYGSWNDFWFLRANRPAMVRFDGTLDYWLDPNDYTKKEDGSESDVKNVDYAGGAYAWIPRIYKCEYVIGDDRYVYFSQQKINDDFVAAGFIDPDGNELPGVWIPMFYGTVDTNGKMRTLAVDNPSGGANRSTQQQYDAITACGARHVFFGGAIMSTLADLLTMFTKTTNSQAAYGNGASSTYNNNLDNYGVPNNDVVGGGQFYGTNTGKTLNKMLHSIVLASQAVWIRDPYTLLIDGTFWVSKDYHYDPTGATYTNTGIKCQPQGYCTKMAVAEGFGALPVKAGGTSEVGYCDHVWVNASGTRLCLRFASCGNGSNGGLFALVANHAASYAWWDVGAAPLLLPPVA